jgi:cell division protein FtsW (lipid II flippase)
MLKALLGAIFIYSISGIVGFFIAGGGWNLTFLVLSPGLFAILALILLRLLSRIEALEKQLSEK